jgi:hypothetical protein
MKWGRWDLNPHAFRHLILSQARLPVPARPQIQLNSLQKGDDSAAKTLKFHHEGTKAQSFFFIYWRLCLRVFVVQFLPFEVESFLSPVNTG